MTAQSTLATRRWGAPAIVTLAAMAALAPLTADAAARQARPAPTSEAKVLPAPTSEAAPRDAGELIIAIVSIKTQQVTFYDADGWILRALVSTGTAGRETPAGIFAVIEKDKDHHSTLYDDAWHHLERGRTARRAIARACSLARLRADALRLCGEAVR